MKYSFFIDEMIFLGGGGKEEKIDVSVVNESTFFFSKLGLQFNSPRTPLHLWKSGGLYAKTQVSYSLP